MGSSVMLASQLRKQLKKNNVTVEHTPVNSIPADADVVLTRGAWPTAPRRQRAGQADRARSRCSSGDPAVTKWSTRSRTAGDDPW